jgi:hypothetical protein
VIQEDLVLSQPSIDLSHTPKVAQMDVQGWLEKRQPKGLFRAWQKRYFALDPTSGTISYGRDAHEALGSSPGGQIVLKKISELTRESPPGLKLRGGGVYFQLHEQDQKTLEKRVWELWCEDEHEGEIWVGAVRDGMAAASLPRQQTVRGGQHVDLGAQVDAAMREPTEEDIHREKGESEDDDPELLAELGALAGEVAGSGGVSAAEDAELRALMGGGPAPEMPVTAVVTPGASDSRGGKEERGDTDEDGGEFEQEYDEQTASLLGAASDLLNFSDDDDDVDVDGGGDGGMADDASGSDDDLLAREMAAAEEATRRRKAQEKAAQDKLIQAELGEGIGGGDNPGDFAALEREVAAAEAKSLGITDDPALLAELRSLDAPNISHEELTRQSDAAVSLDKTPVMQLSGGGGGGGESASGVESGTNRGGITTKNAEIEKYVTDLHVAFRRQAIAHKKRGELNEARGVLAHYKTLDALVGQIRDLGIDGVLALNPTLLEELPSPPSQSQSQSQSQPQGGGSSSNTKPVSTPQDPRKAAQAARDEKIRKVAILMQRQLKANAADAQAAQSKGNRAKAKVLREKGAKMLEDLKQLKGALSDPTVAPPKYRVVKTEVREVISNAEIPENAMEIRMGALRFTKYPPPVVDDVRSTNDASAPYAIVKMPYPSRDEPQVVQSAPVETTEGEGGRHAARLAHGKYFFLFLF